MESCDALLTAIDFFEGTVIMVTHNEMFLHSLAERLIVFQNDHIEVFDGSYREFLEKDGWHDKGSLARRSGAKTPPRETTGRPAKKELRRKKSDIIAQRSKITGPLEKHIAGLERDIESHEIELDRHNQAMQQASQKQDGQRIAELSRAIHATQSAIDKCFDELEKITHELDSHNADFEKQLQALDNEQMAED
jgi:ATP-binding cassette subfamily F protein 3